MKRNWILLTGAGENSSEVLVDADDVGSASSEKDGRTSLKLKDGTLHSVANPPSEILAKIRACEGMASPALNVRRPAGADVDEAPAGVRRPSGQPPLEQRGSPRADRKLS